MLWTRDMEGTIAFYRDVLGFAVNAGGVEEGWVSLFRDDVALMFCPPNSHIEVTTPSCSGSFYFNTDDAAALWETLKDKAAVVYPLEDFDYGMREFALYDNNGYILQFGQQTNVEC